MDNQHTLIEGYRDLSQDEINDINDIKTLGSRIGEICDSLAAAGSYDQRWVEIGKTLLQQGIMALVRAVARPTSF